MKIMRGVIVLCLWTGCGEVVAPKVTCPEDRVLIQLDQTATVPRTGLPCSFADPYPFTVSYAPEVERTQAPQATGSSTPSTTTPSLPADSVRLTGQNVTVTQGSASTLLCSEISDACRNGTSSVTTRVNSKGVLTYQGIFSLEPLSVVLNAGDTFTWEGTAVTENFGPGNSCPWKASVKLTCQQVQALP